MPTNNLPKVLTRAMLDQNFRKALAKDAAGTLKIAGIKLTPEQMTALTKLKPEEWDNLALKDINSRITNAAMVKVSNTTIDI